MDSLRPARSDVLIVLGLLTLVAMAALARDTADVTAYREFDAFGYALSALGIGSLAWRSRFPVAVAWTVWALWTISTGLNYSQVFLGIGLFVVYFGLGAYLPRKRALLHAGVMLGLLVSWTIVGIVVYDNIGLGAVVATVVAVVVPIGFGLAERKRREQVSALELDAARRELAAHDAAAEAVRAERARIARELHDVVAHEMTVMTLQAEGARRTEPGKDPRIAEPLRTIADSGRRGLSEMQRMIGVLRTSEREATERVEADRRIAAGADPSDALAHTDFHHVPLADLAPMPSLAALPRLVQQVEDAGLPVELKVTGTAHVPAGVELSAYRIIQESLTNALKYAGPGAHASVSVRRKRDSVTVDVEDDGRGTISDVALASGGHGLAGMTERVAVLGGNIEYGPRRGGGFKVHVVLPVTDDQIAPRVSRTTPAVTGGHKE
jgi:signal transduction histidine kinase